MPNSVLTRAISQSINIGPDIVVRIEEIRGRQVRVSIEAPREIHVVRSELLQKDGDQ